MIYLDCAASTPIDPAVLVQLSNWQRDDFANPSSAHRLGRELESKLDDARKLFLSALRADPGDRFIFTASATESNNQAISTLDFVAGDRILYCPADHPSLVQPALAWEKKGVEVLPYRLLEGGEIDQDYLLSNVAHARMVLLTSVNAQSGNLHPVRELAAKIKVMNPRTLVHVDAAQSFGKFPHTICHIDSVTVSAHKMGGPKGIGGLFLKAGSRVKPLLFGGGQQGGTRSSTLPAPLMLAFASAFQISLDNMNERLAVVREKNKILRKKMKTEIPELLFPFSAQVTSPYILLFLHPQIPADVIMRHLEERDIFISSTSACSSKIKGENPVLTALNIDKKLYKFVSRLSFDTNLRDIDIDTFVGEFKAVVKELNFLVKNV